MFDGPTSPITQTFGLGMHQPATDHDVGQLEAFFHERGAPVLHEVSPVADESALALLNERKYRPIEFTSVMFRAIASDVRLTVATNAAVRVQRAGPDDEERFVRTSVEGWSEYREYADLMVELSKVSFARPHVHSFIASLNEGAIATGALTMHGGVALLAGASTVPSARNQGAQNALLEHRLRYAADAGCDLAMMCARPGSASQRNAERHGFRIAYTRIKWLLR